ncbi:uncharacterized protein [Periplaneta americana]|uniref:uncharacterized protein n=1 Tax=Periplaneta americana TaxID=6978 RepID=UPI0037E90D5C
MDNLGFQHDVEEASFTLSENSNNEYTRHSIVDPHLLPGKEDSRVEASSRHSFLLPKKTKCGAPNGNQRPAKLSSSSFNLPKNKTLNKYRRFSESFSATSRVPYCVGKILNIPSREDHENVKSDNIICSSFIVSDNNNISSNKPVPDSKRCQKHSCDEVDNHCVGSRSDLSPAEFQPNNLRICSQQNNFQGNNSNSSLLNNVQECSNHTSVPCLPLNNSYHEGYLSSMPSYSKPSVSISPSFSHKRNLISDTSLDIHNTMSSPVAFVKSTNKYSNLSPAQSFLNNAQRSESPFPSLKKKHQQFSEEDADMNSSPCLTKSQNNVNSVLSRATLPTVTIKNVRNQSQEYLTTSQSGIPTVSGSVPMYYSGFLNQQQASPRPCAENRQNMRRSSKIIGDLGSHVSRGATLKKRTILRGWKLQFIPSDHSRRRAVALCCILLLACALVLVATGLVIYMTTAMKSLPMKLEGASHTGETGVNVIAGEFRITNEKFEPSLEDNTSGDFKQLAAQITQQLDILFSASTLSQHYNHSHVTQFSHGIEKAGGGAIASGGILVRCKLVLVSAPPNGEAANQAGLEFLRGLQHHQGQMWLGNFVIDVQSIGFVAVVETASVPEQTPDPALLPGWSSWSSWSACNSSSPSSSLSINTQIRTRSCRLDRGAGAELSNIEPCLLLEQAGGDMEVRDCEANGGLNTNTVTVLSSRVLEEGEVVSNDIGVVDTTVQPTATSSSSSVETIEGNTVTMQSTVLKRTTENLRVVGDNTTLLNTSKNNPAIPVMDLSLPSFRHCDECTSDEVCVALSGEEVPTCRQPHDPNDPTGCGGHCLINTELCHKLDVDAFRCLDDSSCLPNEWRCSNQLCIPQIKRCDGHMNCYDHTDEYDCMCNLTSHFHCSNSTSCLPLKKRCDGIIDCWDGSDELNCTTACPSTEQFTCNDGQCIPHIQFCDGYSDCKDKSDEPFGCGGECKNHEWKCRNGRCIKKQAVCNGIDNCGDESDEKKCPLSRRRLNTGSR